MTEAAKEGSPGTSSPKPLEVVAHVDLQRYLGTWYEIATIPQRFQRGCVGVTAEYTLLTNGDIRVVNTCLEGTLNGRVRRARGKARVVDKVTNARLEVTFFWPFWGAYWIIGLDEDYRWAIVGHPSRKYLWILSRSPQMEEAIYARLIGSIAEMGYDLSKIVTTLQPSNGEVAD